MGSSNNCIFCKVITGEIQSKPVYDNDAVLAFKDLNPQAPTHILIVPKKHISALSQATQEDIELLGRLQWAACEIANKQGLDGFRLVLNNGRIAGQSVDHIHYHLLSGRRLIWPPG